MRGAILVFAGTYEGRQLCQFLHENAINACACVATEYGEYCLDHLPNFKIMQKRLNCDEMASLLAEGFKIVIDATHPYALEVSQNISRAAQKAGISYMRLLRASTQASNDAVVVKNIDEAISYLNTVEGNILATTGVNQLPSYRNLANFRDRLYVRILPSVESIQSCLDNGIQQSHIIAMQGPFSTEMNIATIGQFNCKFLVSKNSGAPGGVEEKLSAARQSGAQIVLIDRPRQEKGYSLKEVIEIVKNFHAENQGNPQQ